MSTLAIEIEEASDASLFKLYDRTEWDVPYVSGDLTAAKVTVTYDGTDYELDLLSPVDLIGGGSTFINIFGTSCSSSIEITPSSLKETAGGTSLAEERFVDGYYEITLEVTYTGEGDLSDVSKQGFIAHSECRATLAPLEINLDNYNYAYNRTLFLVLAQLPSAKYAASLGRIEQFNTIMDRIVSFLDARSINTCW